MPLKIAIIKLGALGDVVRTTSLLRPLHRHYPGAEVWWFTKSSALPLLERNPYIYKRVAVDKSMPLSDSEREFEMVIGLDEDLEAAQLASALTTKTRVGTWWSTDESKVVYSPSSKRWFEMSLLNRDPDGSLETANGLKKINLLTYPEMLMEMLGFADVSKKEREPIVVTDPSEDRWAAEFKKQKQIPLDDRIIAINTGSGARWVNKQLTLKKTAELFQSLASLPKTTLLLLGGPEEAERNRSLLAATKGPIVDSGTANSLQRFCSLVNLCDDLVTSDSLALHIASALGKRVFAFFGPTSAAEIERYRDSEHWLPTQACQCFYLNRCRASGFCLDSLSIPWLVQRMAQR